MLSRGAAAFTTKPAAGVVVCAGEILWDSVPGGLLPGGAPMNVAYHLGQLGWQSWLVSAVGQDAPGEALLNLLRDWQLETGLVNVAADLPTGIVRVELHDGVPSYEITAGVAWDELRLPAQLPAAVRDARALVFGSLAQRSAANRVALARLLEECDAALKVFDLNLRHPWVDRDHVLALARRADLVKLNDEELAFLLDKTLRPAQLETAARDFAATCQCRHLCVTAGAHGAGLLDRDDWNWREAERITVKDTIGAGDAFLAGLLHGLLREATPGAALALASRLAALVASSEGATPAYVPESIGLRDA